MKVLTLLLLVCFTCVTLKAQPPQVSPFIKVDQFGYLCDARKVAVISDPQTGFNAAESFNAGTGTNNYQVRKWSDNSIVYQGTITAWNSGATHTQSGDRGWYFDFSTVTASGIYYIFDVSNNVGSGQFFVGSNVYNENMKAVLRTFYYARCNFAKTTPYAAPEYTDAAAYEGSLQDKFARSSLDKNNASTARDVSGGWFDAGDMNKYVTFAVLPMLSLMDSYNRFPGVFTDNNNIPESGNDLADILDEVKWELEWLKKMQNGTGTNGLFLKVGVDNYSCTNSPPSADVCPRYYIPECTSSTICGAAMFAMAHRTFSIVPGQSVFAADMLTRAQNAFARAATTTSNWTTFQTSCDNGDIKSGDADMSDQNVQIQNAMIAAVYLYSATNTASYRTFVESRYSGLNPISTGWWGPYDPEYGRALLFFANLPGVNPTVKNNILNSKSSTSTGMGLNEYNSNQDLYRSPMPNAQYHWGSNQVKAYIGAQQIDYITNNLNTSNHPAYYELASQYLHYFHGVNALGMTFLCNMYDLYAEKSANEIYHGWFGDGTQYDNALTSPFGAPPGFITGGANGSFSISSITPPSGQPPQKGYKDWNTGWNGSMNENSWEITEPSIYVQAAYVNLLSSVIGISDVGQCESIILAANDLDFTVNKSGAQVEIRWSSMEDAVNYDVQRSLDGMDFTNVTSKAEDKSGSYKIFDNPASVADKIYYRIRANKSDGSHQFTRIQILKWVNDDNITIYQNNETKSMNIFVEKEELKSDLNVHIINSNGQQIFNAKYKNQEKIFIPTSTWITGYYFIRLTKNDSNPIIKKVLVQN